MRLIASGVLLFVLIFFQASFPSVRNEQSLPAGFKWVPVEDFDRNELVQHIIPDKNYAYWQYVFAPFFGKVNRGKVVRSEGDSSLLIKHSLKEPDEGFFIEGEPVPMFFSYIACIEDCKLGYIISEKELIEFIGHVDNLEEALLIASLSDLHLDFEDGRGGSYKETAEGFELRMAKLDYCHMPYKSFEVQVRRTGKMILSELGVYRDWEGCDWISKVNSSLLAENLINIP